MFDVMAEKETIYARLAGRHFNEEQLNEFITIT